jgi:hypothetical protein
MFAGLRFQNIALYFAARLGLPRDIIHPDVTSASGPARSRRALPGEQRQRNASRHEAKLAHGRTSGRRDSTEDPLKRIVASLGVLFGAAVLLFAAAIPARAQSHELLQGTEVHLRLLNGLSTAVAKSGDPFVAEVTQPVMMDGQVILPVGARVHGTVGGIIHTRHFSIFRGQAAMNLSFRDLEVNSRIFPAKMSILRLDRPSSGNKEGKTRKDVKVDEGQVIEAKHDVKGDVIGGALGVGGGTVVGVLFSNVTRGFGFGLIGAAVYIVERKGKEVDLPAETTIRVRMDNTVNLPRFMAESGERESGKADAQ